MRSVTHWWAGGYGPDMGGTATGIGLMRSLDDGCLEFVATLTDTASPAFLAVGGGVLFAAAEGIGRLESFGIGADHTLAALASAPTGGGFPCHLSVIDGRVFVSNYGDGTIGVLGAGPELLQVLEPPQAAGAEPHAHCTMMLDASTLASLDLGTDSVHLYSVSPDSVERTGSVRLPAGAGPRDIVRHRSGLLCILGELGGVLLMARWDGAELRVVASTGLPGFERGDHAAAIALDGDYLYVGLRGSNRISVLRATADGLTVEPVGAVSCEGDWPRHLVADGGILHVANEKSGDVASFRLGADGMPSLIAAPAAVPSPTWLLRVP